MPRRTETDPIPEPPIFFRASDRAGRRRVVERKQKSHQGALLIVRQIERPNGPVLIGVRLPATIVKLDHILQAANAAISM